MTASDRTSLLRCGVWLTLTWWRGGGSLIWQHRNVIKSNGDSVYVQSMRGTLYFGGYVTDTTNLTLFPQPTFVNYGVVDHNWKWKRVTGPLPCYLDVFSPFCGGLQAPRVTSSATMPATTTLSWRYANPSQIRQGPFLSPSWRSFLATHFFSELAG